jgi:hypothetical protein
VTWSPHRGSRRPAGRRHRRRPRCGARVAPRQSRLRQAQLRSRPCWKHHVERIRSGLRQRCAWVPVDDLRTEEPGVRKYLAELTDRIPAARSALPRSRATSSASTSPVGSGRTCAPPCTRLRMKASPQCRAPTPYVITDQIRSISAEWVADKGFPEIGLHPQRRRGAGQAKACDACSRSTRTVLCTASRADCREPLPPLLRVLMAPRQGPYRAVL